jgi:hypothetical protein
VFLSEAKLELLGPYEAWHGAAWLGRLTWPREPARQVLVLLGPEGATADGLGRARSSAACAMGLRGTAADGGVLPLVEVTSVGARIAWVHAHVDGLGLGYTVGSEGQALLSTRAAAEVVASVADVLLGIGPDGHRNRGPEPTDVLVDARGQLHLTGFAGPFPSPPFMRAPRGEDGEAGVVYRLGVLLAQLVSGVPPSPASERTAHAALIRRALIRAMARPGPVLTERYGDWLRGMLAWEASERPPLSAVPDGLRKVAEATGGESLEAWARVHVDELRRRARHVSPRPLVVAEEPPADGMATEDAPSSTEDEPRWRPSAALSDTLLTPVDPSVLTEQRPSFRPYPELSPTPRDDFHDDDPTQEAASLGYGGRRPAANPPRPHAGSSIPVSVGPPPEAIREPPRLPSGFLDAATDLEEDSEPPRRSQWLRLLVAAVWVAAIGALVLTAALLVVYLVLAPPGLGYRSAAPEEDIGLADVLNSTPAPPIPEPAGVPEPPPAGEVDPAAPGGRGLPEPGSADPDPSVLAEPVPVVVVIPTPDAPIAAAISPPTRFAVVFMAAGPEDPLTVQCNDVKAEGIGEVRLEGLARGPCVISSPSGGAVRRANVAVSGPSTFTCFSGGALSCR